MMPSRGFAFPGLTIHLRRAIWQGTTPNQASLIRAPKSFSTNTGLPKSLHTSFNSNQSLSQWRRARAPRTALPITFLGLRFKSTASPQAPTTTASSQAYPESGGSFEQINLEELAELNKADPYNISEHIGFLHELGIEYNWGFRATIEWALEHIHVLGGTPWWLSIVLTTVLFRVVCFPVTMYMSHNAAKLAAFTPITRPLQKRITQATMEGNQRMKEEATMELIQITRSSGTNPLKMLFPTVLPVFIGISSFSLLRAMCNVPVPGLLEGGFLWAQDLTLADPLYIMPFISSCIVYYMFKRGGETGVQTPGSFSLKTMKRLQVIIPGFLFITSAWLPAALQITLIVATFWGVGQSELLRNAAVRERLGLYPLTRPTSSEDAAEKERPLRVTVSPADFRKATESVIDPMKNYQAPQEQKKSILQGAANEVQGAVTDMKKSISRLRRGAIGGDSSNGGQRTAKLSKEFKQTASTYEKRRATEMEDQVWTRQQAKEMRRERRRRSSAED